MDKHLFFWNSPSTGCLTKLKLSSAESHLKWIIAGQGMLATTAKKAIQKLDFIKCSKMMELVKVCAKQVNDDQK